MARRRARHRQVDVSGWKPPGTADVDDEPTGILIGKIDTRDPAFALVCKALLHLLSMEFELDDATVERAVRIGRKEHEQHLEWLDEWRSKNPLADSVVNSAGKSVVYYMRIGDRVKIGVSTNLASRLATINPEELLAVEPGGYDLEKQRHGEYGHLRTHGEWFRLEPPLTIHIQNLREDSSGVSLDLPA